MYEELEKVVLTDGTEAYVVEVYGDHEAYEVEYPTPDGQHRYELRTVMPSEIERAA